MKAIVAVYHEEDNDRWGIGAKGTQPFTLSVDRAFFSQTTKGHPIIVGYKTFLDFPNQKPLPNRRNIILTSKDIHIEGAEIIHSIQSLPEDAKDAFVIGGASVYQQLLPLCDEVYVTHIYKDINADVFFPNLHKEDMWERKLIGKGREDSVRFEIEKFKRREII